MAPLGLRRGGGVRHHREGVGHEEPQNGEGEREERYAGWRRAVSSALAIT